jgi:glycosyltransferase involved in cell wall biosynthesis
MGDVLAAADALIHSSAGLTVLEAIIRGCPVISYGFGVGHVRASNRALQRFGLAQVARRESDLGRALAKALEHRPEPDGSFARRPSTASLIMNAEPPVSPSQNGRAPRPPVAAGAAAATVATAAALLVLGWAISG